MAEVAALKADARSFRIEWDAHGPMAPALDPMEAEHRLKKFQPAFEVCCPCQYPYRCQHINRMGGDRVSWDCFLWPG